MKQIYPAVDHGQGQPLRRGRQRARPRLRPERPVHARRRGGVHAPRRRDVRPRPAHRHRPRRGRGPRARAAHQRRADAVGARGRDAGLPHAGRRRGSSSCALRGYVCDVAREQGLRVGSAGTHPFSLFERQRITAKDRYRAIVDQMQYIARRELIFGMHVHVAVDDPEKAIQVVNGLIAPPRRARRALRELAVLARRADRPRARRATWSSPRSRAPARRRASATTPTTPRSSDQLERTGCIAGLHAHLVGHPPPPAARHDRDPDLRRRHAARGRRSRSPRYCQALVKHYSRALRRAARRSRRSTASSRPRTSGSPRATGSRRR